VFFQKVSLLAGCLLLFIQKMKNIVGCLCSPKPRTMPVLFEIGNIYTETRHGKNPANPRQPPTRPPSSLTLSIDIPTQKGNLDA
jgi:hypothetical protein